MKDFLHNRPQLPGSGRHSSASATAQPEPLFDAALLGAAPSAAPGHEATVEAIKEGERVTKLIVTCRCGEKIEILCAYTPGPR